MGALLDGLPAAVATGIGPPPDADPYDYYDLDINVATPNLDPISVLLRS